MSKISLGPSGLGKVKTAKEVLDLYKKQGITACEIAFTYGVYIKDKDVAKEIGQHAKKIGITLSIHAPYFVNLNSKEPEKIEASKKRILACCETGHLLGAKSIVFHPGYYSDMESEQAAKNIIKAIKEMQKEIKKNKWDVELCPEVMGKINVFGSIDEISKLVKETGCSCCIDFAHILARYKENKFQEVKKAFPQKKWHVHFSGIVYGDKGEKHHRHTEEKEWKEIFNFLKTLNKEIVLICEAPDPVGDALEGIKIWEKINSA